LLVGTVDLDALYIITDPIIVEQIIHRQDVTLLLEHELG
jgi:hypothetical protein